MGNSLGIRLEGKHVVLDQQFLVPLSVQERVFLVGGGFGASPNTMGSALIGEFIADGEKARMEGYMVERLATDAEVAEAEELRSRLMRQVQ